MINLPEGPKLTKSKPLRKAWVYCSADHVSIPLIRMMRLKNLQVTDIRALNLFALIWKTKIKFNIKIKQGIEEDSLSCENL